MRPTVLTAGTLAQSMLGLSTAHAAAPQNDAASGDVELEEAVLQGTTQAEPLKLASSRFTAPLLDLASTLVAKGLAVLRYII